MTSPRIPSEAGSVMLPCDQVVERDSFDMGMREFECTCGSTHAVVMDVHPLSRWIPESVSNVFQETIEPSDEFTEFGTIHLMGIVLEEYPESITVDNATDDPSVGYALLWIADFDTRELHRIIVELLITLIDHAIGHTDDAAINSQFDEQLQEFDVEEFVDQYREMRDWRDERDTPL